MSRVILSLKAPDETRRETVSFLSLLDPGETISSASTSAAVYSGTDANPSALISGAASISGAEVTQTLTGGVEGVSYLLTFTATTSLGQTLRLPAYLAIAGGAA